LDKKRGKLMKYPKKSSFGQKIEKKKKTAQKQEKRSEREDITGQQNIEYL